MPPAPARSRAQCVVFAGRARAELRPHAGKRRRRNDEPARLLEVGHQLAHLRPVAIERQEQQQPLEMLETWMSIDGAAVGVTVPRRIIARRERAVEDVVDVGGDDQPLDRQPHPRGDIAGEDVAEIAGRHAEGDLPLAARRAAARRRNSRRSAPSAAPS